MTKHSEGICQMYKIPPYAFLINSTGCKENTESGECVIVFFYWVHSRIKFIWKRKLLVCAVIWGIVGLLTVDFWNNAFYDTLLHSVSRNWGQCTGILDYIGYIGIVDQMFL